MSQNRFFSKKIGLCPRNPQRSSIAKQSPEVFQSKNQRGISEFPYPESSLIFGTARSSHANFDLVVSVGVLVQRKVTHIFSIVSKKF